MKPKINSNLPMLETMLTIEAKSAHSFFLKK